MDMSSVSSMSDDLPTPKISTADLHDGPHTVRLPQLSEWDDAVIRIQRPVHFAFYEWLGDACLNFAIMYFPSFPVQEAQLFTSKFEKAIGHKILVQRCYIAHDEQCMAEIIKSKLHINDSSPKSYSDYLEFYVGILLRSSISGSEVWNIIKKIVAVAIFEFKSDTSHPTQPVLLNTNDSIRLHLSNSSLSSDSLISSLPPTINAPSRSITEAAPETTTPPTESLPSQDAVSSSIPPLSLTDQQRESPSLVTPVPTEKQTTLSSPNPPKRRNRPPPTPWEVRIAKAYLHFIVSSIITNEYLTLPKEERDSVLWCRNVLLRLIDSLRRELNNVTVDISSFSAEPVTGTITRRKFEGQLVQYLESHALHSGTLFNFLRESEPVREQLERFRHQIQTIIQINANNGRFEGPKRRADRLWRITRLDHSVCFTGEFCELSDFLLNPTAEVVQSLRKSKKRKGGAQARPNKKHEGEQEPHPRSTREEK